MMKISEEMDTIKYFRWPQRHRCKKYRPRDKAATCMKNRWVGSIGYVWDLTCKLDLNGLPNTAHVNILVRSSVLAGLLTLARLLCAYKGCLCVCAASNEAKVEKYLVFLKLVCVIITLIRPQLHTEMCENVCERGGTQICWAVWNMVVYTSTAESFADWRFVTVNEICPLLDIHILSRSDLSVFTCLLWVVALTVKHSISPDFHCQSKQKCQTWFQVHMSGSSMKITIWAQSALLTYILWVIWLDWFTLHNCSKFMSATTAIY